MHALGSERFIDVGIINDRRPLIESILDSKSERRFCPGGVVAPVQAVNTPSDAEVLDEGVFGSKSEYRCARG